MRVVAGSNPAQTDVALAVVRSEQRFSLVPLVLVALRKAFKQTDKHE